MKLPLVVQKSLGCSWLEDSGFNHVADYLTDENAQTIAHRVNVHDELVAALDALLDEKLIYTGGGEQDAVRFCYGNTAVENALLALERAKG